MSQARKSFWNEVYNFDHLQDILTQCAKTFQQIINTDFVKTLFQNLQNLLECLRLKLDFKENFMKETKSPNQTEINSQVSTLHSPNITSPKYVDELVKYNTELKEKLRHNEAQLELLKKREEKMKKILQNDFSPSILKTELNICDQNNSIIPEIDSIPNHTQ